MKFKHVEKVHAGRFIDRYDITYETADGGTKVYEMISRDHGICDAEDPLARLTRPQPDSVILILTNEAGDKVLVTKEFRMACGHWVFNFPAGLIDPGETPEEAARRELWEETGLELVRIDDVLDKSIAAIGFSNEKNVTIFGTARGTFRPSTSAEEEIIPGWYTKAEVRELLRNEYCAARTQSFLYMWSKGGEDE